MTATAQNPKARNWRWLRAGLLVLCAVALCWEPSAPLFAADARLVKIDKGGTGQDSPGQGRHRGIAGSCA